MLRLAVNSSFRSKSIDSVTDVQGIMITVYYRFFRFWGYKNMIPLLMAVSSNPKGNLALIIFLLKHSYEVTLHSYISDLFDIFYNTAKAYFLHDHI